MDLEKYNVFAFVADGDIFHTLLMPKDVGAGITEGLRSAPIVIEVTDRPEIFKIPGWKYNYETQEFYHPVASEEYIEQVNNEEDYEVE